MYELLEVPLILGDYLFKVLFFPLELIKGPGGYWGVAILLLILALL